MTLGMNEADITKLYGVNHYHPIIGSKMVIPPIWCNIVIYRHSNQAGRCLLWSRNIPN